MGRQSASTNKLVRAETRPPPSKYGSDLGGKSVSLAITDKPSYLHGTSRLHQFSLIVIFLFQPFFQITTGNVSTTQTKR
jgi:hypothetical protein